MNLLIELESEIPYLVSFVNSYYPEESPINIYGLEHPLLEVLCAAASYNYYPNQFADVYSSKEGLFKLENWIEESFPEEIENVPLPPEVEVKPLLSIVLPAYNPIYLEQAVGSVLSQNYKNWELLLIDDGSEVPIEVKEDPRIKLIRFESNKGVSAATNIAVAMSSGEYVVFIDHDDYLHPYCLSYIAATTLSNPDFIFSERVRVGPDNQILSPETRTDWNPHSLGEYFNASHVRVYSKKLMDKVGLFDSNFDGTQDYEWMLRALPLIKKVEQIPYVLYYWRLHENNQSASPQSLERLAQVKSKYFPSPRPYTPKHPAPLKKEPLVSIIIPTSYKNGYIETCLKSLVETTLFSNYEVIVVDGGETRLDLPGVSQTISCVKPFNFSERCNIGAEASKGTYLVFLNDDTEIVTPDWIEQLLSLVRNPQVKIAAPQLLFFDSKQPQVNSVMVHAWGPIEYREAIEEYVESDSVCAACFMIRKKDFSGFSLTFPNNYNDVDLGLEIRKEGKIIYTSKVQVLHRSFATRDKADKNQKEELDKFWSKWYGQIFR